MNREIGDLLVASLFAEWRCLLARVFDLRWPKHAPDQLTGDKPVLLINLRNNLEYDCPSTTKQHDRDIEAKLNCLKEISQIDYLRVIPLVKLPSWFRNTSAPRVVPSQLRSSHLDEVWMSELMASVGMYRNVHPTLACLFLMELLRSGGQAYICRCSDRVGEAVWAFQHLSEMFSFHYNTTKFDGKVLYHFAAPFFDQSSCFAPLHFFEQLGLHDLTDAASHLFQADDIVFRDPLARTAFHLRCESLDGQLTEDFLKFHGRAINEADCFNMTPVHVAALAKNFAALVILVARLDKRALGLWYTSNCGVLSMACHLGDSRTVKLLVRTMYGKMKGGYKPDTQPQPLDDQMKGSLSITLKGCGDDHNKLYILQILTRCGVRSPPGEMLSDIVRATKCGMVIQEAIAALEQQWGSTSTKQASGSNQWTSYSGGPSQSQHSDQLYLGNHQPPGTGSQLAPQPPNLRPGPYNDESPLAPFVASQTPADHN
jgi:hypothetical protein